MALHRGIDGEPVGPEPIGRAGGLHEERRVGRTRRLAGGTLACPRCDVPVAPCAQPMTPSDGLACPYCGHAGAVRDFLSLAAPSRPARVDVYVVEPARAPSRLS